MAASRQSKPTAGKAPAKLPFDNLDKTRPRREVVFRVPEPLRSFVMSMLVDERDELLAESLTNIFLVVPTTALLVYLVPEGWPTIAMGVLHLAIVYAGFMQRFTLGLHFASHRTLFGGSFLGRLANTLPGMYLGPFFGIPSGQYYLHHCIMHHHSNNVFPYDVSSTMPYQRDNLFHFFHYWARFTFASWVELPIHAVFAKRFDLAVHSVSWAILFWTAVVVGLSVNFTPVFMTFLLPYFITSFLLMFGNWSQHIFVDPDRFDDNYALAYNTVNDEGNMASYNDGYHLIHHMFATLHWSELPDKYMDMIQAHADNDAFVFRDISVMDVGFMCFSGQLEKLATYFVDYGQKKRTIPEIVAEFKKRLTPIETPDEWKRERGLL